MPRTAKQFLYGAFYLALCALIVVAVLPGGIDEPVPSSVSDVIRPLEVRGPVIHLFSSDGSVALLARVRNPNERHAAVSFPYSFRFLRAGTLVTETPERNGFAYPADTTVLLETLSYATFTEDTEVVLALGEPRWEAADFALRPALSLIRAETSSDDIGVLTEGEIRNSSAVTASAARIVAIVKDADGFPLFAAQTLLEDVPGGASRPFFIRFPRDQGLFARLSPEGTELIVEARP